MTALSDHEMADDMAEFAEQMGRDALACAGQCKGDCRQGRDECKHPQGASACSELLEDDQTVSADAEVLPILVIASCAFLAILWIIWSIN